MYIYVYIYVCIIIATIHVTVDFFLFKRVGSLNKTPLVIYVTPCDYPKINIPRLSWISWDACRNHTQVVTCTCTCIYFIAIIIIVNKKYFNIAVLLTLRFWYK